MYNTKRHTAFSKIYSLLTNVYTHKFFQLSYQHCPMCPSVACYHLKQNMAFWQILPLPQNGGYLTHFLVSYVCALLINATQDQTTLLTVCLFSGEVCD